MENVIAQGYAEEVPEADILRDDGKVWYIPHHGVRHPRKLKLRVVYDCAAQYKGKSLNQELLQGPDLTSSLVGVLTRFREEKVAMMADIEAMFSQVKVARSDRDLLRYLWWPGGSLDGPALEYRMTSHIFGATSSPSCSAYALQKTAKEQTSPESEVHDTIMNNFYVDDCLKSLTTEEQAIELVKELTEVCQSGGFRLTKWVSNSRRVLETLDRSEWAKEINNIDLDKDLLPTERALGMLWCAETDKFKYKITLKNHPMTRRGILSTISGIYDPLGLVSPAVLPARIVFQDLCRLRLDWDEQIPAQHGSRWKKWLNEIPRLEELQVRRCMKPMEFGELDSVQLHHFADASESGYGTASYIRLVDKSDKVHCTLLIGKARVAPLKQMSIPRLELTAATVAVRMHKMISKELSTPIHVDETFFWTDSMTVLRYISNEAARYQTFVANRVAIIRETSESSQWHYVRSALNPADDCSRGLPVDKFIESERWINGPHFLWQPRSQWPTEEASFKDDDTDGLEIKKCAAATVKVPTERDPIDDLMQRYSTWHELKKAVAWILKVKDVLRNRKQGQKNMSFLTVKDMKASELAVVKYIQRKHLGEEIKALESRKADCNTKRAVKLSSSLRQLDPILDEGVLKVGGRLGKGKMPVASRHPLILPKESPVSKLILQDIHVCCGHMGRNYMLSCLHERFWIIGANSAARSIIKRCITCRRQRAKPVEQKMSGLPESRLRRDEPPFSRVGVDYFGPIEVRQGRSKVKCYGVIFTCLAIRAIHLEKADFLDTDSCINAIRRFIARRGPVKEIRSDNGTNFVGAEKELRREIEKWNQAKISETLLQKDIDWIFNPPSGSHFGGVWERQIRTVRKVLGSITQEQTLSDESLQTLFCEVESIVNNRPITKASGDARDLDALTPNHLLQLKVADRAPPVLPEEVSNYSRRRWKQIQHLTNVFWSRWTREYLPQLQSRQKWTSVRRNVQVGDIVLIVDNCVPRDNWCLGRVIETLPDKQGLVRQVKVKTKTTVLCRPVAKLCMLLECDEE